MNTTNKSLLSLYIHIPFCLSKCSYCDFTSFANYSSVHKPYIESLIKEISSYKDQILSRGIKTIFIGGGTPTSLNDALFEKLLSSLDEILNLNQNSNDIEYTVEANPKTISEKKAHAMKTYGVNRVSLGLQSSDPIELKSLGRVHSFNDLKESILLLNDNGVTNINVDLMYAIPNQTIDSFKKSLNDVLSLSVPHISTYSLILEEGTKLYEMHNKNLLSLPTEDEDIAMYEEASKTLTENGYTHYEISNFSLASKECRHNITYWKSYEYLGFGISAHSYYDNARYSNTNDINKYIDSIKNGKSPIEEHEEIDDEMAFEEWIFLRLRMKEGLDIQEVNDRFNIDILDKYETILNKLSDEGLVIYNNNSISLTLKGFELSNYVFLSLLS